MEAMYKGMIKKLSGQSVLIVDNDDAMIASLKRMLEPSVKILVCRESSDAVRCLWSAQPNLVMINMDLESSESSSNNNSASDNVITAAVIEEDDVVGGEVAVAAVGRVAAATGEGIATTMTSTTGFELCSAIKQLEAYQQIPAIPVILYANLDSCDTRERFFMSSADMLLIKPINEKKFVEKISKHSFYSHIMQA